MHHDIPKFQTQTPEEYNMTPWKQEHDFRRFGDLCVYIRLDLIVTGSIISSNSNKEYLAL